MKKLNNTVIKNLSPEMGKKIIVKYEADGWDNTLDLNGMNTLDRPYYGVIGGELYHYTIGQVQSTNARIIELDYEPEFSPKRGDMVMAWDLDEARAEQRIYLTTIDGATYPILTVCNTDEGKFRCGNKFDTSYWKHMKPISKPDPKAEALKKIDEAVSHHLAEVAKLQEEMNRLINEI